MRSLFFVTALAISTVCHPSMAQFSPSKTQISTVQNGNTGPDSGTLVADAQAAFEKLQSADLFATGGIGITGKQPPVAVAYHLLMKHPQGAKAFRLLLKTPGTTPEGRAFALSGLARLAPTEYDQLLKTPPAANKIMVRTAAGCMFISQPLTKLARDFKNYAAQERASQTENDRKP